MTSEDVEDVGEKVEKLGRAETLFHSLGTYVQCRKHRALLEYLQVLDRAQDFNEPGQPGAWGLGQGQGTEAGEVEVGVSSYAAPSEGRATWTVLI